MFCYSSLFKNLIFSKNANWTVKEWHTLIGNIVWLCCTASRGKNCCRTSVLSKGCRNMFSANIGSACSYEIMCLKVNGFVHVCVNVQRQIVPSARFRCKNSSQRSSLRWIFSSKFIIPAAFFNPFFSEIEIIFHILGLLINDNSL